MHKGDNLVLCQDNFISGNYRTLLKRVKMYQMMNKVKNRYKPYLRQTGEIDGEPIEEEVVSHN